MYRYLYMIKVKADDVPVLGELQESVGSSLKNNCATSKI